MLASELWSFTLSKKQTGLERCHWCGARCGRDFPHDDDPLRPFIKNANGARCPSEPWACIGCIEWRRPRRTITYLDRSFKDSQTAASWSWWITTEGAFAVRGKDSNLLWPLLLAPPMTFVLAMKANLPNRLHLATANVNDHVQKGNKLTWTLDGQPLHWTPYELEQALRNGDGGREPGVRKLIELLGHYELPPEEQPMVKDWGKSQGSRPTSTGRRKEADQPGRISLPDSKKLLEPVISGTLMAK